MTLIALPMIPQLRSTPLRYGETLIVVEIFKTGLCALRRFEHGLGSMGNSTDFATILSLFDSPDQPAIGNQNYRHDFLKNRHGLLSQIRVSRIERHGIAQGNDDFIGR